ncbi:toxin of the bsrG/SR4 type I toxin antitoxin system [Bacillus methanolicus MGA3]|uniref:Toxin of the bsrG/SR4 type I toxin antitoxin system n=1 Tax=Bacillus methanolicus (strain MGA3 / ATCC 53907) TaxID=796606 RepID=A0A0B5L086_BACMM|nr:toxin of the bsrG/SR4 type I toxin antitoxin system [Bacillus methanolicus MGA3]
MTAVLQHRRSLAIVVPAGVRPMKQDRPLPQFAVKGGLFILVKS